MAGKEIVVTRILKTHAGKEKALITAAPGLMIQSLAEEGCLSYYVHQSKDDPTQFMIFMHWRDEAAFKAHLATPFIQDFENEWSKELLAEPYHIELWEPLA